MPCYEFPPTRETGYAEVVGDTGVLVEPRDAAGLRAALESRLEKPERIRQLGRATRDRIATEFAWPVIARRDVDLYAADRVRSRRPAA